MGVWWFGIFLPEIYVTPTIWNSFVVLQGWFRGKARM